MYTWFFQGEGNFQVQGFEVVLRMDERLPGVLDP